MLQEEMEEQLQALAKQVDELRAEVETLKEKKSDEDAWIPGAEYDFVPNVKDEIVGAFVMRVGKIRNADSRLSLTDEEWQLFSTPDDL